jgi:hypothetical protein
MLKCRSELGPSNEASKERESLIESCCIGWPISFEALFRCREPLHHDFSALIGDVA